MSIEGPGGQSCNIHTMDVPERLTVNSAGLSGEFAVFLPGQDFQVGIRHWLMRPEAVEAFFVLWRVTGNAKYREWGWRVFEAAELHCRVSELLRRQIPASFSALQSSEHDSKRALHSP